MMLLNNGTFIIVAMDAENNIISALDMIITFFARYVTYYLKYPFGSND